MTAEEQIMRLTKLLNELDLTDVTQDEMIKTLHNLSFNEIVEEMWQLYCFASDVCVTLNM